MLQIRFRSDAEHAHEEIVFEAPYERLSRFIADDVQRSSEVASRLIENLKRVIAGTHAPLVGDGNAWTMDVDAKVARLTCYFATPVSTVELPTSWLLYALEQWRDHLLKQGK